MFVWGHQERIVTTSSEEMQTVPSSTHSWQMLPPCNAVSVLVYQTILRWCVCFALYQDHVTCILSASLDLRTCPDTLLTFYQADEDQELVKNAHHEFVCICRWWWQYLLLLLVFLNNTYLLHCCFWNHMMKLSCAVGLSRSSIAFENKNRDFDLTNVCTLCLAV